MPRSLAISSLACALVVGASAPLRVAADPPRRTPNAPAGEGPARSEPPPDPFLWEWMIFAGAAPTDPLNERMLALGFDEGAGITGASWALGIRVAPWLWVGPATSVRVRRWGGPEMSAQAFGATLGVTGQARWELARQVYLGANVVVGGGYSGLELHGVTDAGVALHLRGLALGTVALSEPVHLGLALGFDSFRRTLGEEDTPLELGGVVGSFVLEVRE